MRYLLELTDDERLGEFDDSAGQIPPVPNALPLYSDAATLVNARVAETIEDACNEIDTYVSTRYVTPASPVPPIINTIAVDIAVYRLHLRRGGVEIAESVMAAYKSAVDMLKQIRDGKLTLNLPETLPSLKSTGAFKVSALPPVFANLPY